jgi:hypothetical protein
LQFFLTRKPNSSYLYHIKRYPTYNRSKYVFLQNIIGSSIKEWNTQALYRSDMIIGMDCKQKGGIS